MSTYDHNLTWEISRIVGITSISMYFNFLVVASERHLTERTGDYRREASFASLVFNMAAWSPSRRLRQGNYSK